MKYIYPLHKNVDKMLVLSVCKGQTCDRLSSTVKIESVTVSWPKPQNKNV
jgi:hypothetical protein